MDSNLDQVREQALANFDVLLNYWKLDYKKITEYEYDIIATWRKDNDFGGCRFNLTKARGADFAGGGLTKDDISNLDLPFGPEDYAGFTSNGQGKIGFDIVGLAQRVHKCSNYTSAAGALGKDLSTIAKYRTLHTPASDAAMRRKREQEISVKRKKQYANDLWESCMFYNFEDSAGSKYLYNRHKISVRDANMRCHPGINYAPTKTIYPALIFKVQKDIDAPLVAIHRIYLSPDGYKAKVDNPKMALAPIQGMGIWFGQKRELLCITEGPENALSLRQLGYNFVCSSIFGSNLHSIYIPSYVKKLLIFPDMDEAGQRAFENCKETYGKLTIPVEGVLLPKGKADWNDVLSGVTNG